MGRGEATYLFARRYCQDFPRRRSSSEDDRSIFGKFRGSAFQANLAKKNRSRVVDYSEHVPIFAGNFHVFLGNASHPAPWWLHCTKNYLAFAVITSLFKDREFGNFFSGNRNAAKLVALWNEVSREWLNRMLSTCLQRSSTNSFRKNWGKLRDGNQSVNLISLYSAYHHAPLAQLGFSCFPEPTLQFFLII